MTKSTLKQFIPIICLFLVAAIISGPLKDKATVSSESYGDDQTATREISSGDSGKNAETTTNAADAGLPVQPASNSGTQKATAVGTALTQVQQHVENLTIPEQGYFIKTHHGEIAVFSDENASAPLLTTGISTSVLRSTDKTMIDTGIWVYDIEDVAALLEDFGS